MKETYAAPTQRSWPIW